MNNSDSKISSPYLSQLVESVEAKSKGLKHYYKEWSYKTTEDDQGIEILFERFSEKPSRLTIWVWENGSLCLDIRTYAKHDGWEFEHRVEGSLSEHKFEKLVSLIKEISQYYVPSAIQELEKRVENLA